MALGADTVLYKQLGSCRLPDQVGEAQKNWQAIVMVNRYASLESDKGQSPLQRLSWEFEESQRVCNILNSLSDGTEVNSRTHRWICGQT
jgi:hypothetical protein